MINEKKWIFDWKLVEWTVICRDLYQHRWMMSPLNEENSQFLRSESNEVCLVMGNCSCSDSTRCCDSCVIPYNQYQSIFFLWIMAEWSARWLQQWVAQVPANSVGLDLKLSPISWRNLLIIGIDPAASAWRHVLMSLPHKNDIYNYIHTCTFLLIFLLVDTLLGLYG